MDLTSAASARATDPHRWLEEIDSPEVLAWVDAQNRETEAQFMTSPDFEAHSARFKTILDSDERFSPLTKRGDWLYNFWTDKDKPRGQWRRTTQASYLSGNPDWDVVIDLDALAETVLD